MRRRSLWASLSGLFVAVLGTSAARAQAPATHKIVFHVGSGDPDTMREALHNIANAAAYYAERNEPVAIELVANGHGYTMLRADTSPVKQEVAETKQKYPFVVFSACQNSRAAMARAEHKSAADIPELPEATDVPAGVVRLAELQEQRYGYIRV
jgi:intracellular sulfur oxidation DsrE/DsrF family protein